MGTTTGQGPVIGGMPPGYPRYWQTSRTRNTQKRKKPQGLALLSNPTGYHSSRWDQTTEPDLGRYGETTPYYGSLPHLDESFLSLTGVEDAVRERLRSKIKDEKWNLSTFVGELPTTITYLKGAIKDMTNLYSAVKRGKIDKKSLSRLAAAGKRYMKQRGIRAPRKATRGLSSRWLEYRYAISPIVYDLDDMLSALNMSLQRPLISRVASALPTSRNEILQGNQYVGETVRTAQAKVRGVCYFTVNPYVDAAKKLGLINLAATLWELLPLSFVVDMVLPVGAFIGSLDAMAGVSVLSCTMSCSMESRHTRLSKTYVSSYRQSGVWYYFDARSGAAECKYQGYTRSLDSVSRLAFRFTKTPNANQLLDLVALSRVILLQP